MHHIGPFIDGIEEYNRQWSKMVQIRINSLKWYYFCNVTYIYKIKQLLNLIINELGVLGPCLSDNKENEMNSMLKVLKSSTILQVHGNI